MRAAPGNFGYAECDESLTAKEWRAKRNFFMYADSLKGMDHSAIARKYNVPREQVLPCITKIKQQHTYFEGRFCS